MHLLKKVRGSFNSIALIIGATMQVTDVHRHSLKCEDEDMKCRDLCVFTQSMMKIGG
jgi:hypothetical protein